MKEKILRIILAVLLVTVIFPQQMYAQEEAGDPISENETLPVQEEGGR